MTILKCILPGELNGELKSIVEHCNPEIGFYILNNLNKCKHSSIIILDTHIMFIYINNFKLEYNSYRKMYFDNNITNIELSGFDTDKDSKIIIPIDMQDHIIDYKNMQFYSIDFLNLQTRIKRLYFESRTAYYVFNKKINIKVFNNE